MEDHLQVQQQQQLQLPPGFRFHPTDVEIITSYLVPKVLKKPFDTRVVAEVDPNKHEPWELPDMAIMGEKEWYFFSQKDRKYPTGIRTNRATTAGYWKATGKDKEIFHPPTMSLISMKKTLVFYKGRAPKGEKTNWIMHEYRLESGKQLSSDLPTDITSAVTINTSSKDYVVCKVFHKSIGLKKVVMSSYTMPMPMTMGVEQQHGFFESVTLPPLMDYSASSSLAPPLSLPIASSYELQATGTDAFMMDGAFLPIMNGHYFGNHHHQMMAAPPQLSIPFYHHHQEQQRQHPMMQMQMMEMEMSTDQGFMVRIVLGSEPSSIVSQEDVMTGLKNNDLGNGSAQTPDEISSVNMGMDGMWKF